MRAEVPAFGAPSKYFDGNPPGMTKWSDESLGLERLLDGRAGRDPAEIGGKPRPAADVDRVHLRPVQDREGVGVQDREALPEDVGAVADLLLEIVELLAERVAGRLLEAV